MSQRLIKAVMFDLDGTLLDTSPDFVVVVNRLRHQRNLVDLPEDVIRQAVSNGSKAVVEVSFNIDEAHAEFEVIRQQLLTDYLATIGAHTQYFEGIEHLLAELQHEGIPWGIATNKPWLYTEPLVKAMGFPYPPASVICPEHVTHPKPAPDSLFLAASQLGCDANEIMYIGDHKRDIDCGRHAGSLTIAACYGYLAPNDDVTAWQADYHVSSANALWPIIAQHL